MRYLNHKTIDNFSKQSRSNDNKYDTAAAIEPSQAIANIQPACKLLTTQRINDLPDCLAQK